MDDDKIILPANLDKIKDKVKKDIYNGITFSGVAKKHKISVEDVKLILGEDAQVYQQISKAMLRQIRIGQLVQLCEMCIADRQAIGAQKTLEMLIELEGIKNIESKPLTYVIVGVGEIDTQTLTEEERQEIEREIKQNIPDYEK